MSTSTKPEEKQKAVLEWEPHMMDPFEQTQRINSKELASNLTAQFQDSFADCIGCYIEFVQNRFTTIIYFENNEAIAESSESKIKNLDNVMLAANKSTKGSSFFDDMKRIENKRNGKTFVLNDVTKEMLEPFMPKNRAGKVNWEQHVFERTIPAVNSFFERRAERVIIGVKDLDLNALCRAYFGSRMLSGLKNNDKGTVAETTNCAYLCQFAKQMPDGSMMINVKCFSTEKVEELDRKENPITAAAAYGGIQMY